MNKLGKLVSRALNERVRSVFVDPVTPAVETAKEQCFEWYTQSPSLAPIIISMGVPIPSKPDLYISYNDTVFGYALWLMELNEGKGASAKAIAECLFGVINFQQINLHQLATDLISYNRSDVAGALYYIAGETIPYDLALYAILRDTYAIFDNCYIDIENDGDELAKAIVVLNRRKYIGIILDSCLSKEEGMIFLSQIQFACSLFDINWDATIEAKKKKLYPQEEINEQLDTAIDRYKETDAAKAVIENQKEEKEEESKPVKENIDCGSCIKCRILPVKKGWNKKSWRQF